MTAFGVLGDQARAERDAAHAVAIVHTDYTAHVSVLTHAANLLRRQGHGTLVVFSSVAGVRVRRANYVYGSAKAGLDGFASGLADALYGSGVHLLLVRPGFVIGRMTPGDETRTVLQHPGPGRRRHRQGIARTQAHRVGARRAASGVLDHEAAPPPDLAAAAPLTDSGRMRQAAGWNQSGPTTSVTGRRGLCGRVPKGLPTRMSNWG